MTGALDPSTPVAVIGAGTMGRGIARVAAGAGHPVLIFDASAAAVTDAIDETRRRLLRDVEKGRLDQEAAGSIADRITPCSRLEAVAAAGLVIEAILEDLDVKTDVFRRVESVVDDSTILASNTSSLSITAIGAGLSRPDRMAGMHFFNPAQLMPLVEVVVGDASAGDTVDTLMATAAAWGKTPVRAASTPGFIVNRVARPFYGEGLRLLQEGVADHATIDDIVTGAGGFRMGPFRLLDLVGLDVNLAVSNSVYEQTFHDARFAPNVIQQSLVHAGRLGRKTGRGFYDYGDRAAVGPGDSATGDGAPSQLASKVLAVGDLGHAAGLVTRLDNAGVAIEQQRADGGPGHLRLGGSVLVPTDGRCATELAAAGTFGTDEIAVVDLARDWASATRVAVTEAAQATGGPGAVWAAAIEGAGVAVSLVGDSPGLVLMRIVSQLASVAADAVLTGVAVAEDVDTAMRLGTNYPAGPLEWADALGAEAVVSVLDHLQAFYGEDRYRAATLLRRSALVGSPVRGGT
ncbi:MAG: 3-hydroxyacyl-CoA dehydrogenase [Acidimicrobiia bacterium]